MSGLFSTFNIAKRGMTVQQKAIDVTSHNISNAGTVGYSRQRVVVETTRPMSVSGVQAGQIGTGAQVAAIERVRDTFLDYQVRGESSTLGKYDTRANFLHEVESILNEPSETGISTLMGKFFDAFQELSKQPSSSNARTVVAQQTAALCQGINSTYNSLEKLQGNAVDLTRSTVTEVNSLVTQIDRLNQEIIQVTVSGNTPNDLMDKRDLLIDKLSSKMNIVVEKRDFNGVDIKPAESGNVKVSTLVNSSPNGDVARFSFISSIERDYSQPEGSYVVTYYKNGSMDKEDNKQTIRLNGLTEAQVKDIEESRILWSNSEGQAIRPDGHPIRDGEIITPSQLGVFTPNSGEFSGLITVRKDIEQYMDELNRLAKGMALTVNGIHSGVTDPVNNRGAVEKDFLPFFVNSSIAKYDKDGNITNLDEVLIGEENIGAKNLSINTELLNDVMKIKTKTHDYMFKTTSENHLDGEGDGARALAIAQLRNVMFRIQDINGSIKTRSDMFDVSKGGNQLENNNLTIINTTSGMKLDSYFKDTIDRLGVQSQEAKRMVANQEDLLYSLEESRLSVSGVSLDEEMANLVQFQHAYNANAKVISTLDELLDVVVNGLKR